MSVLKKARDIFVFGCTAGLRYADLIKLKKTYLQNRESEIYLALSTQKTEAAVSIIYNLRVKKYCRIIQQKRKEEVKKQLARIF